MKLTLYNKAEEIMISMYRSFIPDTSNQEKVVPHSQPIISQIPEPEKIRHTLIGSSEAVMGTIQVLHQLGGGKYR